MPQSTCSRSSASEDSEAVLRHADEVLQEDQWHWVRTKLDKARMPSESLALLKRSFASLLDTTSRAEVEAVIDDIDSCRQQLVHRREQKAADALFLLGIDKLQSLAPVPIE